MTVSEIIERVRWCIDEENLNTALLPSTDDDDGYMDHIIAAKVDDALRWLALYAPDSLMHSDNSTESTTPEGWKIATEGIFLKNLEGEKVYDPVRKVLTVTLPADFGKLTRVRLSGWYMAVRTPIEEDSDEYAMLASDTAHATNDRPVAALIRTSPNMMLECWPAESEDAMIGVNITYACVPDAVSATTEGDIDIPKKMVPAFIYYVAYLTAVAYRESVAATLLGIAQMHLGITGK